VGLGLPTEEDSYRRASGDALTEPAAAADPVTAETQIALPSPRSHKRLFAGLLALGVALSVLAFFALHSGSAQQPLPAQANGATSVAAPPAAPPSIVAVAATGQTEPASDLHAPLPTTTATRAPTSKKQTTKHTARPPSKRPEDLFSRK
ncbi:MAG TPA: hypothetical protein VGF76_07220, partial [Polyangiaceae bacterium]